MTRDEIIKLAREAGFREPNLHDGCMGLAFDYRDGTDTGASLERFATLVAAAEREAWRYAAELEQDRKRLEDRVQGEQEPVAWRAPNGTINSVCIGPFTEPLYTAPPQREWQGLTDEERLEILAVGGEAAVLYVTEAKLKEKNT